jgi:hypothetical protein
VQRHDPGDRALAVGVWVFKRVNDEIDVEL